MVRELGHSQLRVAPPGACSLTAASTTTTTWSFENAGPRQRLGSSANAAASQEPDIPQRQECRLARGPVAKTDKEAVGHSRETGLGNRAAVASPFVAFRLALPHQVSPSHVSCSVDA